MGTGSTYSAAPVTPTSTESRQMSPFQQKTRAKCVSTGVSTSTMSLRALAGSRRGVTTTPSVPLTKPFLAASAMAVLKARPWLPGR